MKKDPRRCSGAAAMTVIGERYALSVLRELFFGVHRFDDLARNTGAPRDVLTVRLRSLEQRELIRRVPYSARPLRNEYHLSTAAVELLPLMIGIMDWGHRWIGDAPSVQLTHSCGSPLKIGYVCRGCGEAVEQGRLQTKSIRPVRTSSPAA